MVDFGESDRMIRISGKVDKSNTHDDFISNIWFLFEEEFIQAKIFSFSTF